MIHCGYGLYWKEEAELRQGSGAQENALGLQHKTNQFMRIYSVSCINKNAHASCVSVTYIVSIGS